MAYNSEQVFLDKYADPNKTYKWHPGCFRFKDGTYYDPDFYCVEDDTYIEVVGKSYLPHRHRKLRAEYPDIKFHVFFVIKPFEKLSDGCLKCDFCGHIWRPRVASPRACPNCICRGAEPDPEDIPFSNLKPKPDHKED